MLRKGMARETYMRMGRRGYNGANLKVSSKSATSGQDISLADLTVLSIWYDTSILGFSELSRLYTLNLPRESVRSVVECELETKDQAKPYRQLLIYQAPGRN